MPLQLRSLPALLLAALLPLTGLAQSPAPEPLELAAAERKIQILEDGTLRDFDAASGAAQ